MIKHYQVDERGGCVGVIDAAKRDFGGCLCGAGVVLKLRGTWNNEAKMWTVPAWTAILAHLLAGALNRREEDDENNG